MACNSCNDNSLKLELKWEPLSQDTIDSIKNQIEHYKSLDPDRDLLQQRAIADLSATCTGTSKTVGDIVHLSAQPNGGTAPYKVTFNKDSGALGSQIINVVENQLVTYDYTTVNSDISTTAHAFSATTIDSCSTGAKTITETCNVTVSAVSATCNMPACNLIVT